MRQTILLIRHEGCPISDVSAEVPSVRVYNLSRMTVEETEKQLKSLLKLVGTGTELEAFLEGMRAHPADTHMEQLSPVPSGMGEAYVYVKPNYTDELPSVAHALSKHECFLPTQATVQRGLERWPLYVSDEDEMNAIIDAVRAFSPSVRVEKNRVLEEISEGSLENENDVDHYGLTSRQLEVLLRAFELGYYADDRSVTMSDVGDAVGLTSATVCEHLNNAENKIIRDVVRGDL